MADESKQLRVRLVTPERTLFEHRPRRWCCRQRTGTWRCFTGSAAGGRAGRRRCDRARREPATEAGGPAGDMRYNVSWGFVEVLPDRVTILATDALKPEEIDVPRAQTATGAWRQTVERSGRQRRGVHRSAPRNRRSRSQAGDGRGEALRAFTHDKFKAKALLTRAGLFAAGSVPELCWKANR